MLLRQLSSATHCGARLRGVDEAIAPQGQVIWSSRAGCSCSDDGLPSYAEYPT